MARRSGMRVWSFGSTGITRWIRMESSAIHFFARPSRDTWSWFITPKRKETKMRGIENGKRDAANNSNMRMHHPPSPPNICVIPVDSHRLFLGSFSHICDRWSERTISQPAKKWAWSHDHRPSTHTNNQSISWLHLIYIMHANHQTWLAHLYNVGLDMLQIIQAKEGSFSCLPLIDWLILSQKTPFTQLNPSPFFLKANFPRRVRAAWRIIFIPIARQFIYTSISHPFPPKAVSF